MKSKIKWTEVEQPQPKETSKFRVKIINETGNNIDAEPQLMSAIIMGKLAQKHVSFYHYETKTKYICGNAPADLRLAVADKTKKIIQLGVKAEVKKDIEGKPENYFKVLKYCLVSEEE